MTDLAQAQDAHDDREHLLAAAEQTAGAGPTPELVAERFHEAYERLAPQFGYKTRDASAVPWGDVPESNRRLMVAVAGEVLAWLGMDTSTTGPRGRG